MKSARSMFALVASIAVASAAPVQGQDPHGHDTVAPAAQAPAPANCPMNGRGAPMQQGMMMGGQQMQQMMQTMQQMHGEMQQMHKEMMQMHEEMQRRHAK